MLLSGWILPNGSEISCTSCSNLRGHISAIKKYLEENPILRDSLKISDSFLDDYAIKKLGWIKVMNIPYKYVFYSGKDKYDNCSFYEKYGYTIVEV